MSWWGKLKKKLEPPKSFQRAFRKQLQRDGREMLWNLAGFMPDLVKTFPSGVDLRELRERVTDFLFSQVPDLLEDMDDADVAKLVELLLSLSKVLR